MYCYLLWEEMICWAHRSKFHLTTGRTSLPMRSFFQTTTTRISQRHHRSQETLRKAQNRTTSGSWRLHRKHFLLPKMEILACSKHQNEARGQGRTRGEHVNHRNLNSVFQASPDLLKNTVMGEDGLFSPRKTLHWLNRIALSSEDTVKPPPGPRSKRHIRLNHKKSKPHHI